MKTILVPIDFSKTSNNALEYAIEMAKVMPAKIVLFHAYHVPVVMTEALVVVPSMEDVKQIGIAGLKEMKNNINHKHGKDIQVEYCCTEGFAVDEINVYTSVNKIDLIIMGMHGGGFISERFVGSTTTSLLRESNCPVMAISTMVKFKTPKKMVFACDYKLIKNSVIGPLKEIAKLFSSHVYILNVVAERETVLADIESSVCGLSLDYSFEDIDHSFEFTTNENVVDGINKYVSNEQMDIVVMVPRKYSLLKKIVYEPNTKRMAFHTTVPVLALHEQQKK